MAVEFLKRTEPEVKFLAVEKLNLLYNMLTTVLIIVFFNRLHDPQSMLMGRFFIAAGTFVFIYIYIQSFLQRQWCTLEYSRKCRC